VNGKINYSFDFERSESDYLEIGDINNFTSINGGAVSLWVKPETLNSSDQFLFESRSDGTSDLYCSLDTDRAGNLLCKVDSQNSESSIAVNANQWSHIVLTWNITTGKMYVNGSLAGTISSLDGQEFNGNNLDFGRRNSQTDKYYDGIMDEIGIWNRTLNADEVSDLYNNGKGRPYGEGVLGIGINLNSPTDTFNTTSTSITFNCTAYDDINLTDVYFILNGTIEETNSSGINNKSYIFTKTLSKGKWNWTCGAKDNDTNYFNATTRSFEIKNVINNGVTYNSTTYETMEETISVNLTANSSLTNVELVYDGTTYSTSKSGNVYSKTLQMPLVSEDTNKTFYWKYTFAGSTINSDEYNQTIQPIKFTRCNATYSTPFINFTFEDEDTLSSTVGQFTLFEYTYWLGNSTLNISEQYINNTNLSAYDFCFSPSDKELNIDMYLQYKNDDAPQRIYDPDTTTLTNTTTNQTLYLLNSLDGIYVTFQFINLAQA